MRQHEAAATATATAAATASAAAATSKSACVAAIAIEPAATLWQMVVTPLALRSALLLSPAASAAAAAAAGCSSEQCARAAALLVLGPCMAPTIVRALLRCGIDALPTRRWPADDCAAAFGGDACCAVAEEHIAPGVDAGSLQLHSQRALPPLPAFPSSASVSLQRSLRRSLHSSLRAMGLAHVTHSVFRSRNLSSGAQSLARGGVMLLASAGFVFLWSARRLPGLLGRLMGLSNGRRYVSPRTSVELAADARMQAQMNPWARATTLWPRILQHLAELQGGKSVATYAGIVVGSVALFSAVMGVLRTLNWIAPPRDGYPDIARSMSQLAWPFTRSQRAGLDMPPVARASFAERSQWMLSIHPLSSALLVGPYVEELGLQVVLPPTMWILSWFTPAALAGPGAQLALRAVIAGFISGAAHFPAHKRPSAALLASFTQVLEALSPHSSLLLPTAFHSLVNYVTRDAYAAISPLRGLALEAEVADAKWSNTPEAQAATRELRDELEFFLDPTQHRWMLRTTVLLRQTPLLRALIPARHHAIFAQPTPVQRRWFSGEKRPSPCALSTRYTNVVVALFQLLDPSGQGWLDERALAFLLLLRPEHLDVLRAAFTVIDSELATSELLERSAELEREFAEVERRAAMEAADADRSAERLASEKQARERAQRRAYRALGHNVRPLEDQVVHVARRMPDEEEADERGVAFSPRTLRPEEVPFPSAHWVGMGKHAVGSLSDERLYAKQYLLARMEKAGAQLDPAAAAAAAGAGPDEPQGSPLGWSLGLMRSIGVQLGVPGLVVDGGAPPALPLPPDARARFNKLMMKFGAYVSLYSRAAFRTHLRAYGEEIPDDDGAAFDEPPPRAEGEEEEEKKDDGAAAAAAAARPGTSTRRFTVRSLCALVSDLALLDAPGTDAMLAHAVLVLNGTMPHPMVGCSRGLHASAQTDFGTAKASASCVLTVCSSRVACSCSCAAHLQRHAGHVQVIDGCCCRAA